MGADPAKGRKARVTIGELECSLVIMTSLSIEQPMKVQSIFDNIVLSFPSGPCKILIMIDIIKEVFVELTPLGGVGAAVSDPTR